MFTQTTNKSNAEAMYGNFTNAEGATITTGHAVCLTTTAASVDGNLAVLPGTSNVRTFIGVADEDVADNAIGRYQAYGYAASVFFFRTGDSLSITTPDHAAGPAIDSQGVSYIGITTLLGPVIVLESIGAVTASADGYVQGFIRAM